MKNIICLLLLVALLFLFAGSMQVYSPVPNEYDLPEDTAENKVDTEIKPLDFSKKYSYEYTDQKGQSITVDSLPYWFYEPKEASNGAKPLIVVLHSAYLKLDEELTAEENLDIFLNSKYDDIPKHIISGSFGELDAYILMPQTGSSSMGWAQRGEEVAGLALSCMQKYNIDSERVALMGFSVGGTGVIEVASAYPEIFKNVLSVAGGIDGVSNKIIPYDCESKMRYPIADSEFHILKTDKKVYMKFLFDRSKDKNFLAVNADEAAAAQRFMDMRVAELGDSYIQNGVRLLSVVGEPDVEVNCQPAAALCEYIVSNGGDAEIIKTPYGHGGVLDACTGKKVNDLVDKERILSFILGQ